MHTTHLRKVGGSVMLAVPRAVLDVLGLRPGAKVGIAIERGRLVVEPPKRPRYTRTNCSPSATPGTPHEEEREWFDNQPAGRELI